MATETKKPKRIQTTVMLDPELRKKLRRVAADDDKKVSDVINQAVRAMFNLPHSEIPSTTSSG